MELETIQDEKMLKNFSSAMEGGIYGVMGNRYINGGRWTKSYSQSQNQNQSQSQSQSQTQRSIWYVDANNLYGYALMQKLPYKEFSFTNATLDRLLNTPDDSCFGYWLICDLEYTNECKDRTGNFQLLPYKREVENNELGYK